MLVFAHFGRFAYRPSHGVGAFQRGDDAFDARELHKGMQTFLIISGHIVHPPQVFQKTVLRANARVIQSRSDGVHGRRFALIVFQYIAIHTVKLPRLAHAQRSGVSPRFIQAFARRFHTNQMHGCILQKRGKYAHGIAAAAYAGDHMLGQLAVALEKLRARFIADNRLKIAHHHRKRVRPHHRANGVNKVFRVL